MHLVIDSTGLKVYGEGEWKQRIHGKQKRRTWRKLHLAVDSDTGLVTAATLTDNTSGDGSQVEPLLEETLSEGSETKGSETTLERVGADGAYDTFDVYDVIGDYGATPVIPPQKNAKIKKHENSGGRLSPAMRQSDTSANTGATSGNELTGIISGAWPRRPSIGSKD